MAPVSRRSFLACLIAAPAIAAIPLQGVPATSYRFPVVIPRFAAGVTACYVVALEDLSLGDFVVATSTGAERASLTKRVSGVALATARKGEWLWVQTAGPFYGNLRA